MFLVADAYGTTRGASYGKRATETLVVDARTGDTIGFTRALLRTALSVVGTAFFAIGLLVMFTNRERRTAHDLLTNTRVISP